MATRKRNLSKTQKAPGTAQFAEKNIGSGITKRQYSTPTLSLQPLHCPLIRRWQDKIEARMESHPEDYGECYVIFNLLWALFERARGHTDYTFPGGGL